MGAKRRSTCSSRSSQERSKRSKQFIHNLAKSVTSALKQREILSEESRDRWNPAAGPNLVLVRDPHGKSDEDCGTFLVFRKLEQNVKGFKRAEKALAKRLHLKKDDTAFAGTLIVGRFHDGMPVADRKSPMKQPRSGVANPPLNDFNYKGDRDGNKCPLFAHTRKTATQGITRLVAKRSPDLALDLSAARALMGIIEPYDYLATHPDLDSLRSDKRFQNLLTTSRRNFDGISAIVRAAQSKGEAPEYIGESLEQLVHRFQTRCRGLVAVPVMLALAANVRFDTARSPARIVGPGSHNVVRTNPREMCRVLRRIAEWTGPT
jgi:hypothetical protein